MPKIIRPDAYTGACRVDGATGNFVWRAGVFLTSARTGVGAYTLTYRPTAINENIILLSIFDSPSVVFTPLTSLETSIDVQCLGVPGFAPADTNFQMMFIRARNIGDNG